MTESLLNFALVPDASFQRMLNAYQQQFVDYLGDSFQLFRASAQHITVCQVYTDTESATKSFNSLPPAVLQQAVNLAGLTFLPSSSGATWVEISVLKSDALRELQNQIVTIFGAERIKNDIGDHYRPHITLGKYKHSRAFEIALPYDKLRADGLTTALRVGASTHFEDIII